MPVDPKGWKDGWDVDDEDGATLWRFELEARPAEPPLEPHHAFIGTVTVSDYVDSDEPVNPRVVFRCERGALTAAVTEVKEAARRAEQLRVGPRH